MTESRLEDGPPDLGDAVTQVMTAPVIFADGEVTLRFLAETMTEQAVGSVILLGPNGPSMMVTEQDVVSALAGGSHPDSTWAADVATPELISVGPEASLLEAIQIMAANDIRHLPVRDRGEIVGMVSSRDILRVVSGLWTQPA